MGDRHNPTTQKSQYFQLTSQHNVYWKQEIKIIFEFIIKPIWKLLHWQSIKVKVLKCDSSEQFLFTVWWLWVRSSSVHRNSMVGMWFLGIWWQWSTSWAIPLWIGDNKWFLLTIQWWARSSTIPHNSMIVGDSSKQFDSSKHSSQFFHTTSHDPYNYPSLVTMNLSKLTLSSLGKD